MNEEINIFFSTNDEYVPYLGVCITSLMENASKDNEYKITVLHSGISEYNIRRIKNLSRDNWSVSCLNVEKKINGRNYYAGPTVHTKHISKETFYRLLIPELFSELQKVIYLDCDIVVLGDISEFYSQDLDGKTIGAVYSVEQWSDGSENVLPNNDKHEWFNAGVMLIDLERYRKLDFVKRCEIELSKKIFDVVDQDLLRIVCYGETKYLPFEWNVLWHHIHNGGGGIKEHNRILYNSAKTNPKIIHYSGGWKPWKLPGTELSEFFWQYARKTDFYEEILYKNIPVLPYAGGDVFSTYIFPFDFVPKGSNVILYGAGKVGKIFRRQIEITRWCNVIAWVDKNCFDQEKKDFGVISPDNISRLPYDSVVIAVENKAAALDISVDIKDISNGKNVVWTDYRVISHEGI